MLGPFHCWLPSTQHQAAPELVQNEVSLLTTKTPWKAQEILTWDVGHVAVLRFSRYGKRVLYLENIMVPFKERKGFPHFEVRCMLFSGINCSTTFKSLNHRGF